MHRPRIKTFYSILSLVLGVIGAFLFGVFLLNFIIMPWLVRHGKENPVPNLIGKTLSEAEKILSQKGFHLGKVLEIPDTTLPKGYIIDQKPAPGNLAKIGRFVSISVSAGPERVRIPFLTRLTVERAQKILENLGLKISYIETIPSRTVPQGRIVQSFPPAGEEVPKATGVRLSISGFLGSFPMPNLIGLELNTVTESLKTCGLILGEIKEVDSDEKSGRILVQYPEDGMNVKAGDTVRLIIAKKR